MRFSLFLTTALVVCGVARGQSGPTYIPPSPPLYAKPFVSTMVGIGDSYIGAGWNALGAPSSTLSAWLGPIAQARMSLEPKNNFAIAGENSTQILQTQLGPALALSPNIVIMKCCDNDYGVNTLATTESNLTTIFESVINAGAYMVMVLDGPRTTGAYNAGLNSFLMTLHQWVKEYSFGNPGMFVYDPIVALGIQTTGYANPSYMQADGIHPNSCGAYNIANTLITQLSPYLTLTGAAPYKILDVYDSSVNTTGNVLSGPFMLTTSGTITNSGPTNSPASGPAPYGWNISFNGKAAAYTGTATTALTARADTLAGQLYTVTLNSLAGGNNNDFFYLHQTVNFPSTAAPGQIWEGTQEVIVGSTNELDGFLIGLSESDGSGASGTNLNYSALGGPDLLCWPQGPYSVILKTPAFVLRGAAGGSTRTMQISTNVYVNTSGTAATGTISFGRASLRQVGVNGSYMVITTPTGAVHNSTMNVSGTYVGNAPTGVNAWYDSSTTVGTLQAVTNFTSGGGTFSFTVVTPGTAGTHVLFLQQQNNTPIMATASFSVS